MEVTIRLLRDKAISNDSRKPPHARVYVEFYIRKEHANPQTPKVNPKPL